MDNRAAKPQRSVSELGQKASMTLREWHCTLTAWHTPKDFTALLDLIAEEHGSRAFTAPDSAFFRSAWPMAQLAQMLEADRIRLCPVEPPDAEIEVGGQHLRFEVTEADRPGRRRNKEVKNERRLLEKLTNAQPLSEEEAEQARLLYVSGASTDVEKSAVKKLRAGLTLTGPERLSMSRLIRPGSVVRDWPEAAEALTPAAVDEALRAVVERKVRQDRPEYGAGWHLLIYLNLSQMVDPLSSEAAAAEAAMAAATASAGARFTSVWVLWKDAAFEVWCDGRPSGRVLRRRPKPNDLDQALLL